MIKMELIKDPSGREDSFVVIEDDGETKAYRETKFEMDIEGTKKIIIPRGKR